MTMYWGVIRNAAWMMGEPIGQQYLDAQRGRWGADGQLVYMLGVFARSAS